jgi:transcriptional regulator with PAS, ATPase and Fis domain
MSKKILFAWLGMTDLRCSRGEQEGLGPIGQAVTSKGFDSVQLLSNDKKASINAYCKWLRTLTAASVGSHSAKLTSPNNFGEIYEAAEGALKAVRKAGPKDSFVFHLSPGTPAMAAVWIILSRSAHPAELIQSSVQEGVRSVSLPFEISAEYVPTKDNTTTDELLALTQGLPPVPAFESIVHRCVPMQRAIAKAQRIAQFDVPVLIQGESGTGKELFARAIHEGSGRSGGPIVEVNCGALPSDLIESELFGHKKGAFTGADENRKGYLEEANGGTLFLDEVGELPLAAQVKLLRVLQEGEIIRVGETKKRAIDIRIVAATHVVMLEAVEERRFREDLFHRLAVGVLHLPPLRQRRGDLNLLIDNQMARLNAEHEKNRSWIPKRISPAARAALARHRWPGNVRELFNTLARAAIWSASGAIEVQDVEEALFPVSRKEIDPILNRELGDGFQIDDVLGEVSVHYLKRAMELAESKEHATELLGLSNSTTLNNRLKKFDLA